VSLQLEGYSYAPYRWLVLRECICNARGTSNKTIVNCYIEHIAGLSRVLPDGRVFHVLSLFESISIWYSIASPSLLTSMIAKSSSSTIWLSTSAIWSGVIAG